MVVSGSLDRTVKLWLRGADPNRPKQCGRVCPPVAALSLWPLCHALHVLFPPDLQNNMTGNLTFVHQTLN